MSNKKEKKLLQKKTQRNEENALNEPQEESKEDINEALQDDFSMNRNSYIFPENHLFTEAKQDLLKPYLIGNDFSLHIWSTQRLPKFNQNYYIRVKIKRTFMNKYLINALNKLLKEAGFFIYFTKFPQKLANNMTKEKCKILMDMRLKDIFEAKELYEGNYNKNYNHNSKLVYEIEKKGKPELIMILNRKLRNLFEEYLNSEEFGKIELNRLKSSNIRLDEYYIKKYVYLAKFFIGFCEN